MQMGMDVLIKCQQDYCWTTETTEILSVDFVDGTTLVDSRRPGLSEVVVGT